jgi:hypothetical protein
MQIISGRSIKVFLFFLLTLCIEHSVSAQCIGVVTAGVGNFWDYVIAGA